MPSCFQLANASRGTGTSTRVHSALCPRFFSLSLFFFFSWLPSARAHRTAPHRIASHRNPTCQARFGSNNTRSGRVARRPMPPNATRPSAASDASHATTIHIPTAQAPKYLPVNRSIFPKAPSLAAAATTRGLASGSLGAATTIRRATESVGSIPDNLYMAKSKRRVPR